jgi:hypothetical protein
MNKRIIKSIFFSLLFIFIILNNCKASEIIEEKLSKYNKSI